MTETGQLFTIGHSNHGLEQFLDLLRQHDINAIGDVRSSPYSRYSPHFSQGSLQTALASANVAYVFLGKELGARADNPAAIFNGRVSYKRLAARPEFTSGLDRVRIGARAYRLALLCAEKDPIDCHRMILVCRQLRSPDIDIRHILADGSLETNAAAEMRLCGTLSIQADLFLSEAGAVELAYDRQSERIAYTITEKAEAGRQDHAG